jgi:hypothetical protein
MQSIPELLRHGGEGAGGRGRAGLAAYGRTLAYVYLDTEGDGEYEHLYNEDLITEGLACTTTFSHAYRREFERLRE